MSNIQRLQEEQDSKLKQFQWDLQKEIDEFTNPFPFKACQVAARELRNKYENFAFYVIDSSNKFCRIQFGVLPWSPMYTQNNILTVTVYSVQGKWKIKFDDMYIGKTTVMDATIDIEKTGEIMVDIISKHVEDIKSARRLAALYIKL